MEVVSLQMHLTTTFAATVFKTVSCFLIFANVLSVILCKVHAVQ